MSAAPPQAPAPHQGSPHTVEAFLAECQRRGIKLTVQGETIKASGRPPAKPEAFKAYLIAKKPELLKHLQAPQIGQESASQTQEDRRELSHVSEHSHGLTQEATVPSSPPGSWRSPDRIAQEKLFYRLAVGELIASWEAGKPLHQGSVLQNPRSWIELAYDRYQLLWWRCEEERDPALRSRLEIDRDTLFGEALEMILQAKWIEETATSPL